MRFIGFRFIPVIILLLVLLLLIAKPAGLFQPTVKDMAGMNFFMEEPYELTVHFDFINDDFVMYYDGTTKAQGDQANREGKAVVYYMNAFFYQDCKTQMDGTLCCKEWRSCWASADFASPLMMINTFQELAVEQGIYMKRKVPASDYSDLLEGHYDGYLYRVILPSAELDWKALCDVSLDTSFGGQDRLREIPKADVTLLYGAENLLLKGVQISFEDDVSWLSGWIRVKPADESVQMNLSDYEIREDGLLSEEWEIALPNGK